ncbi:MAG: PAS domain S-box protein [Desulfovibrio aminophilus]|uniref:PAS domain S-box protein n=1 Tax=Desulfovibrio aminophilus TaxID=81425 RepID=UPI0039EC92DA
MRGIPKLVRQSLTAKLIISTGLGLLLSIAGLSYLAIVHQEEQLMGYMVAEADRLGTTIKLGTHYAMMLNSREDIQQIIANIGRQKDILALRIYNKAGEIKYSNVEREIDTRTNIEAEACHVCHRASPPLSSLALDERIRVFENWDGTRLMGILDPVYNEPGCTEGCHYHPSDKKILGAIDVVVSLEDLDREVALFKNRIIGFTAVVFLALASVIYIFMLRFVIRPIRKLIVGTQLIAKGGECSRIDIDHEDEMGQLAKSITDMGRDISNKQIELNRQKDEYQYLFSHVPCIITVQDRNFRLLRYNLEFKEKFKPKNADFCYHAYKGRNEKCPNCPVELTFQTGRSYCSEESGPDADGRMRHWLVTTSPVRNAEGEIVAAMEMSLDISSRKQLEQKLERSERKYLAIFKNTPNPLFVLDAETLNILDCNESAQSIYGFEKNELVGTSFLEFWREEERETTADLLRQARVLDRAKNVIRDGRSIYVTVRVSPSEYSGRKVLLVTTSDITKRLETEQQLIQASKMATLGEMATGVAHELNQPLSVIKTASSFIARKISRKEPIDEEILGTMAREIDSHVDRATRIINHLREFGRKPEMSLEPVRVNEVLRRAFDIFSQQLKLREITVDWRLDESLPPIKADPGRLEQVFINMLINARDAIEERWAGTTAPPGGKRITITSRRISGGVRVEVEDTGRGIPRGILDKIFEPFFTTKKVGKGTGLGLSISYGIIKDCGGTIRAESVEGEWTRFVMTFPEWKNEGERHG